MSQIQKDFEKGLPMSFNSYSEEHTKAYYENLCDSTTITSIFFSIKKKLWIAQQLKVKYSKEVQKLQYMLFWQMQSSLSSLLMDMGLRLH